MERFLKGRAWLAVGLAGVTAVLVGAARADGPRLAVGPNVNVSVQTGNQTEVGIGVNPMNTMQVWAGWNGSTTHKRSTDGGTTWVAAPLSLPHGFCCDTQVAWDTFGNLFVTYLDANAGTSTSRVKLEWSQNGGQTFAPVPGLPDSGTVDQGSGTDQPSVEVGPGSVWVSWRDGTGIKARGALVTGSGAIGAWTAEQGTPNQGTGNFGDVAVGPLGQVVITYQTPSGGEGPATVYVHTDPDGVGPLGFGAAVAATTTNVGGFDFIPAQDGRSVDAEASLEYDLSAGTFNGRLYLVYTEETVAENNDLDIMLRRSTDNGATWSAPVKLNDDATTRTQMLPSFDVDQTNGRLSVAWHDARNDAGNNNTEYWGTSLAAGGTTVDPNFKISAGVSNDDAAQGASGIDYGDYTWGFATGGIFQVAWADNSNSTANNPNFPCTATPTLCLFDVYTARITPGPTALTVIDLRARRVAGGVEVTWRTANEADVLGFDVLRTVKGRAVKVNRTLVVAKAAGRTAGASYRLVDRGARGGTAYGYRLRVLGASGARWLQGTTAVAG